MNSTRITQSAITDSRLSSRGNTDLSRGLNLLSAIEDIIFVLDRQFRHTELYGKWLSKYSIDPAAFLNKTATEVLGTDEGEIHIEAARLAFTGEHVTYEWAMMIQGQQFFFQTSLFPLYQGNKISEIIGVGRDITSLKQVQKQQDLMIRLLDKISNTENIVDTLAYVINETRNLTRIDTINIVFCTHDLRIPVDPPPEHKESIYTCQRCCYHTTKGIGEARCQQEIREISPNASVHVTAYGTIWTNEVSIPHSMHFAVEAQSVALIPVRQYDTTIAMLHLSDANNHTFTPELIALLENICRTVTVAITKKVDEQILYESEQTARTLLDLPHFEIFMITTSGMIIDANHTGIQKIGKQRKSVIGSSIYDHISTGAANIIEGCIDEVLRTGRLVTHEQEISGRFYYMRFNPIFNQSGDITKIAVYAHDLTEYRTLLRRRKWLSSIVESSPDAIISILPDGTVMSWNKAAEQLYGHSAGEMIGVNIKGIFSPERLAFYEIIANRVIEGHTVENEEIVRTIRGKPYILSLSVYPIVSDTKELQGMSIVLRDISTQKKAESVLLRQSLAFENIAESLLITDLTSTIIDCNEATEKMFGYSRDEIIGQDPYIIYKEDDAQENLPALVQHAVDTGRWSGELMLTGKDNIKRICDIKVVIIYNKHDHILGAVTIIRDVTERKHWERKIEDYQSRLRSLVAELTVAEDRERKKIAVVLHDSIAQLLALSKMNLDSLNASMDEGSAHETLSTVSGYIKEAIRSTRNLSFELCPAVFYEDGLRSALAWLAEHTQQHHTLNVTFSCGPTCDFGDESTNILVFQAVRELLINTVKHSHAQNVSITAATSYEHTSISVQDDGLGFKLTRHEKCNDKQRGFGLFSITERLRSIGGEVHIDSKLGNGTCVTLIIPHHKRKSY